MENLIGKLLCVISSSIKYDRYLSETTFQQGKQYQGDETIRHREGLIRHL